MTEKTKKDGRRGIWGILHFIARHFMAPGYGYSYEQSELDAPFLLVSNHVTDLDPFFVGLASKNTPLTFVASEHITRMGPVSGIIMKLLRPIPRAKAASGATTVKNCLRRIRGGEAIALFAEGDCTWDGVTAPVFPATGKLAKASGAPLVTFRMTGLHPVNPRWAYKRRGGRSHGGVVRVYSPEELSRMTAEEVTAAIDRDIFEDAWETQKKQMTPLGTRRTAEGLERAICVCPECRAVGSLKTKNDTVFCTGPDCGFTARIDRFGFIEGGRPFSTVAEWDAAQKRTILRLIADGAPVRDSEGELRGRLTRVKLDGGKKERPQKAGLRLDSSGRAAVINGRALPFSEIEDMEMVRAVRLLFTTKDGYYEFKCKKGCLRKFPLFMQAARSAEERKEV